MLCFYLSGWATEAELITHIDRLHLKAPRHAKIEPDTTITLDTCFAGLAQPTTLSDAEALDTGKAFRRLSVIRADTEPKARNLLLAGSDDQRAVWENGGIFTQALIRGLKGDADLNRDGVIQSSNWLAICVIR